MSDEQKDEDLAIVAKYMALLGEHFDSVRIFVTRHQGESDDTVACTLGMGNFYAQVGQVQEWLVTQDENVKEKARGNQ